MAKEEKERELRVKSFTITQAIHEKYWLGYDEGTFDDYENWDNLESLTQQIADKLERDEIKQGEKIESEIEIVEIASILHDKDKQKKFDVELQQYVYEDKHKHVHIFVELSRTVSLPLIAERLGIASNFIEQLGRGRYAKENTLAYLVHAKNADKYLYDPRDVVTLDTFDYLEYYGERHEQWQEARATKKKKEVSLPKVDWLVEKILLGEITREEIMLTDDYFSVYASNKKRVDEAFEVFVDRKIFKGMEAMRRGDFTLKCYYITGQPDSGKTVFAKGLVGGLLAKDPSWTVFEAGATNPLDGYRGEEIIFMDDPRASAFGASDWLKLLDPINTSPISARYKNRTPVARVLVMTAYMPIDEFFYYVRDKGNNRSEALDQFLRRFAGLVQIVKMENGQRVFHYLEMKELDNPKSIAVYDDDGKKTFAREGENLFGDSWRRPFEKISLNFYPQIFEGRSGVPARDLEFEKGLEFFIDYVYEEVKGDIQDVTPKK